MTDYRQLVLGDLGQVFGGGTPSTKEIKFWDGDIPWATPSDITALGGELDISSTRRSITEAGLKASASKLLPPMSVLMTSRATIGSVAINQVPMCTNQGFISVVPTTKTVSPKYLAFWIIKNRTRFLERAGGSTFLEISRTNFKSIPIVLPSLGVQEKVAHVLDQLSDSRRTRLAELKLERERKAALMDFLFTHGTHGESRKETELGEIPESWGVRQIGSLGIVQSGGTPSRKLAEHFGGETLWVKTLDLNETWLNSTEECITAVGLSSIRGKIRPSGTVMVAMYGGAGTIGKAGILQHPAATNQAVCCIEPNPDLFNSEFLFHYLVQHRKSWMKYAIGTRKDPNISKGVVERYIIPFPSLEEQTEIGSIASACLRKIEALEFECKLLSELFSAMLEELMSGRLSVEPLLEVTG